jgi:hypothetical protein
VAYLENEGPAKEAVFNWFLPSVEATIAMLRTVGFEDVSLAKRRGDRAVVVARKPAHAPDSRAPIWLESRLTLLDAPASVVRDAPFTVRVRAENRGLATWLASGAPPSGVGAVRLGAHLLDAEGEEIDWEYGETALGRDVLHGKAAELELSLFAPESPGTFDVEIDLLAENVAWFDDLGSPVLTHRLVVRDEEPRVPWFRELGVSAALTARGGAAAGFDALVSAFEGGLGALKDEDAVEAAFRAILGQRPDATALAFHRRELARRASGRRRLVKELLIRSAGSDAPPPAPPMESTRGILERLGIRGESPARAGESFPGEAQIGETVLAEGASLDDAAFVSLGFTRILGREVDDGGRAYYAAKLSGGEMNRPHFLRDLLWSAELRA